MKRLAFATAILALFILLVSLFSLVWRLKEEKPQEVRLKAAPATTLSLSPATAEYYLNQTFTTEVKVNTGGNLIVSVDLVLNFNPQVLEATNITMGNFLPGATEIQKNINNQTGKIIYSFYTMATNARSGQGTLATITFKGKAAGNSAITFNPQSAIGAIGEKQNVLTGTSPASYTVKNDTAPPTAVSNLQVTNVTMETVSLSWTAPADPGPTGKAAAYDLRYSTSSITESNWSSATVVMGLPTPGNPGSSETFTVSGLAPNTTYFFGLKSKDASNNFSSLSNIASGTTLSLPRLNFQIKFQGITSQKPNRLVRVILKQGATIAYTFNNVSTTANLSGVYSGSVSDIGVGSYNVYIKGPVHLQKNFGNVTLNPGINNQNWSGTNLKAGDIDGNNTVNAVDIAKVIEDYFPNTPAGSPADFNLDGTVNAIDIGFVIGNYFQAGDQ